MKRFLKELKGDFQRDSLWLGMSFVCIVLLFSYGSIRKLTANSNKSI